MQEIKEAISTAYIITIPHSCRMLSSWCVRRLLCTKPPARVKKSFEEHCPVLAYCQAFSTPLHPALRDLHEETLKLGDSVMMGAPEVLSMNMFLIRAMSGKKVLDIGVYTGSSSSG